MKRIILSCLLLFGIVIYSVHKDKVKMAELQQSPEAAQNASFLHLNTSLKVKESGVVTLQGAAANDQTTTTITLVGYPQAPAVLCFLPEYGNAGTILPAFNWTVSGNTGVFTQIIYSNVIKSGTNYLLTFTARNFAGTTDTHIYTIKYYVYQETTSS